MRKIIRDSLPAFALCAIVGAFFILTSIDSNAAAPSGAKATGDKCASANQAVKKACSQQGMQDQQQSADQSLSGYQDSLNGPSNDLSNPGAGVQQTADAATGADNLGANYNNQFYNRCQSAATQCTKACQGNQAGLQACKDNQSKADQAKDQAKNQGGGGQMPQMPQMPQDQASNTPPPTPTPFSTMDPPKVDNNQCTGKCCNSDGTPNTTNPGCGTPQGQTQTADSTKPGFTEGSGGGGSSSSGGSGSGGMSTASADQTKSSDTSGKPSLPGSPNGGQGLGAGGKANTDPKERAYSLDEGKMGDVLQGERSGGGGGGGGGFSYANGQASKELEDYLPGHSKDPNKKRGPAGNQVFHADVVGKNEDIFAIVSKRYKILCGLKELRDCEAPMSTSNKLGVAPTRSGPTKAPNLPMSGPTYIRRSD